MILVATASNRPAHAPASSICSRRAPDWSTTFRGFIATRTEPTSADIRNLIQYAVGIARRLHRLDQVREFTAATPARLAPEGGVFAPTTLEIYEVFQQTQRPGPATKMDNAES